MGPLHRAPSTSPPTPKHFAPRPVALRHYSVGVTDVRLVVKALELKNSPETEP